MTLDLISCLRGLGLSSLVLGSAACWSTDTIDSNDVAQEEIHGDYWVQFDEGRAELRAHAQFRVGGSTGTTVRLRSPSQILFEGESMRLIDGDESIINLVGTFYATNLSVEEPEDSYLFSWTDGDGRTFENFVEMAELIAIVDPVDDIEHSRREDLVVDFDPPVGPGDERVTCYLFGPDADAEDGDEADSVSVTAGSQCVFTSEVLASFEDGRAHLEVRRRLEQDVQQGHARTGAQLSSTYESLPVLIELVP